MPANQGHGFTWEDAIKRNVFHVTEVIPYTEKFDIPCRFNCLNSAENISVKAANGKAKSVDMGDALRIYKNKEDTTLIVILYEQVGTKKKVRSVVEVKMPPSEVLFGDIREEEIQAIINTMRAIPPGSHAALKAQVHAMTKALNARSGAIKLRAKMDSKSQRRLQCSFDNFPGFLEKYPSYCIIRSNEAKVRGVDIPCEIESACRQRNTRVKAETVEHSALH